MLTTVYACIAPVFRMFSIYVYCPCVEWVGLTARELHSLIVSLHAWDEIQERVIIHAVTVATIYPIESLVAMYAANMTNTQNHNLWDVTDLYII